MTEAIFGLVGVVIGGLLNVGVAWVAERRQAERSARIATRLIAAEIDENRISMEMGLNQKSYHPVKYAAGTSAWDDWRETLADVLPVAEWNVVSSYYVMENHLLALSEELEYVAFDGDDDAQTLDMTLKAGNAGIGLYPAAHRREGGAARGAPRTGLMCVSAWTTPT